MTSDPDQPSTLAIGRVVLTVHDLDAVGSFYQRVVGLRAVGGAGDTRLLGAGERVLLELRLRDGLPVEVLDRAGRANVARLVDDGLLTRHAERLVPTRQGRLLADALVRDLLP